MILKPTPQLRMRSSGMMVIKLVVIQSLQRQSQKWKGKIQWPSSAKHLMLMETDRRQKLPWKCIVSVTVSSRYVACVALLIYKYACIFYWYYKMSVLYLNISFFLAFRFFLPLWTQSPNSIAKENTDSFSALHSLSLVKASQLISFILETNILK